MKKVIFVCLLTLSVCFSQQTTTEDKLKTPAAVAKLNATTTDAKTADVKPEHTQTAAVETPSTPPATATATVPATAAAQNATATNNTQTVPASNETSTKTNETKPAEKTNSTDTKPSVIPVKPVDPPKANNDTKPAANVPVPNNGTNADSKDSKKNETTTPKGENVSPTAAPVEAKSRAFDGPSFIGGIILTLGLLAIGFMGFKYYKNQTERNYHTL